MFSSSSRSPAVDAPRCAPSLPKFLLLIAGLVLLVVGRQYRDVRGRVEVEATNSTAVHHSASQSSSNNVDFGASKFESRWGDGHLNATRGPRYRDFASKCCGSYINTHSGCKIARWYYSIGAAVPHHPHFDYADCDDMSSERNLTDPSMLREHDTVYVTLITLEHFAENMLDGIKVDVVLISGQSDIVYGVNDDVIGRILNHPHVTKFFCQNLKMYGRMSKDHPKLYPFPYGLKGQRNGRAKLPPVFVKEAMEKSMHKDVTIYAGPLTGTNAGRRDIPKEEKRLPHSEFYRRVAAARYLISPDGDRPDCYRHYEAIFLGTVPITQLDPFLYRHLEGAPVVFDNEDWNLTSLEGRLDPNPKVNRNLVFEQYWIDWVDDVTGIELNWSDDREFDSRGFLDEPYESWAPIRDEDNDWISVSDRNACYRYSQLYPPGPEWGSEAGNESIKGHVACCSKRSDGGGADGGGRNYSIAWFGRESGWAGKAYRDARPFCSAAGMDLCSYAEYCPRGKYDVRPLETEHLQERGSS